MKAIILNDGGKLDYLRMNYLKLSNNIKGNETYKDGKLIVGFFLSRYKRNKLRDLVIL